YIRNKQRLIELLNEQKTAIINRAVTKGINPNVPMKHSGIEWLGEIPAHWQLVKLGNLCWKVADGPHFSPSYLDEGIMFLSARNVKVDSWSLEDIKYISQKDYKEFCKRIIPETGDILYTKGGTTGIARVVDLEEPFQVWVHIAVLKLKKEKINPYLLAYILNGNACYQQSQLYTRGATNQDLGLTRMVNIVFAIPPSLEEQQYIVDYLKNEISKIALAIAQIEKEIELIQEYRTTLISDAVTGKIDVRGFDNGSNSKNSPKPPELATM
ncbi:MAG: restriction endonuclease subunit S, partial [Planktothrix sp.]|uniref:restriction endonuclease subunit S n=1 Tax=Planktothrix sp. TaxID=3088171 RepID=UPI0038D458F9